MDRQAPSLRVQIGNEVVLRRGEVEVLERDTDGRATVMHLRPQLQPGEILCERLGDIPLIFTDAECSTLVPPAPAVDFDAWMRHRVNVAHAKYMERTSYHLRCDWSTKAITAYLSGPGV